MLKSIQSLLTKDGKLLITCVNPKWLSILKIFEKINLKEKTSSSSYIHPKKISNIAKSNSFELNQYYSRQVFPFNLLGIGSLLNKFFELLFIALNVGIKNYMVFGNYKNISKKLSKSIIIPAKNEEKPNSIDKRIPEFDEDYELVVVYGESKDKTEEVVLNLNKTFENINISVLKQTGNGKANDMGSS